MSSLLHSEPFVQFESYLDDLAAVDLTPVNPAPAGDGSTLDEWLIGQAGHWRYHHEETGDDAGLMVASLITRIAQSVRFHRATSTAELLARSPLYRRADLDLIDTPPREERRFSLLAQQLDQICEDMLHDSGIAARLVAWAVLDLAHDADFYHADTLQQFDDARAAWEAACEADSLELAF